MNALLPWRRPEVDEVREAVKQALAEFATGQQTVVIYKPVIQVNIAIGGGATVNVRPK